jgi:deazaflavin-dependent oxidoreductase (nitroreductase family)
MYRGGRPNRLAVVVNRAVSLAGALGWGPRRLVTLEVRGRRTGRTISFPLMTADLDGERYLVAMLGERAGWVANVRAAGGRAVLRRRRREPVRLEEVDPRDRAPILRRYLQVAHGGRPHLAVDRRAPLSSFERVADRYPVFRVVRDPASATASGDGPGRR